MTVDYSGAQNINSQVWLDFASYEGLVLQAPQVLVGRQRSAEVVFFVRVVGLGEIALVDARVGHLRAVGSAGLSGFD